VLAASVTSKPPSIGGDRSAVALASPQTAPGNSVPGLLGPGRPLSDSEREFYEPRFSARLEGVRVHSDDRAADSAMRLGARAYSHGDHIVLGSRARGHAAEPEQSTLAHELAHVVLGHSGVRRQTETMTNASMMGDVLLEPLPVSPPQVRVHGSYTDEQISQELYGKPSVPLPRVYADTVEVYYSTLRPKWKPAFRDSATHWEQVGAEEREQVGRRQGETIIWEDRLRWQPVEDSRRGGLVVAYKRSSGGYTEVRNTAGEIVFVDEIPIESVRIPILDDVGDALKQVGYAAVGVVDAWLEDNWRALGLPPHERPLAALLGIPPDSMAYQIGRGGGHLVSLLQAAAEIVSGAAVVTTAAGEALVAIATTPAGGAGLVVMPVAVVTAVAGTAVVVHGGVLANAVFMNATESGGGGSGGGKKGKPWSITPENTAESRLHNRFGRFDKSKSDGLWWSRDRAGHGGSVWKVFTEESGGLRWIEDADEFGNFIEGKHKGPTGLFIPWAELTPI